MSDGIDIVRISWCADFLVILEGWHYLDIAATLQKSQVVIDVIDRVYGCWTIVTGKQIGRAHV